jgi:hypothetical protein
MEFRWDGRISHVTEQSMNSHLLKPDFLSIQTNLDHPIRFSSVETREHLVFMSQKDLPFELHVLSKHRHEKVRTCTEKRIGGEALDKRYIPSRTTEFRWDGSMTCQTIPIRVFWNQTFSPSNVTRTTAIVVCEDERARQKPSEKSCNSSYAFYVSEHTASRLRNKYCVRSTRKKEIMSTTMEFRWDGSTRSARLTPIRVFWNQTFSPSNPTDMNLKSDCRLWRRESTSSSGD